MIPKLMCVNFRNYWNFLQCKNILWNQKCVKFSQTNTIFDSKTLYTPEDIISVQNKQGATKVMIFSHPGQSTTWTSGLATTTSSLASHTSGVTRWDYKSHVIVRNNNQKPFLLLLASWGHLTWHVFNTFIGEIWLIVLDWFVFLVSFPVPAF